MRTIPFSIRTNRTDRQPVSYPVDSGEAVFRPLTNRKQSSTVYQTVQIENLFFFRKVTDCVNWTTLSSPPSTVGFFLLHIPARANLFINMCVVFLQGDKGNHGRDGKKGEPGICDIKVRKRVYNSHILAS